MKKCNQCGNLNEDVLQACAECGELLEVQKETNTTSASTEGRLSYTLNAKIATAILLAYLFVQFLCIYLVLMISDAIAAGHGIHDPRQVNQVTNSLAPTGLVLSLLLGGMVMVFMSKALIPGFLRDANPNGAACVVGRWNGLMKGLVIGLIIGVFDQAIIVIMKPNVAYRNLDTLHRMAFTPGLAQIMYFIVALLLAPVIEEMLFRGVFYGGYRKSFGPMWAALATSLLFAALHLPYYIHFLPNIVGIIGATLATLWCRLHWNAVGPAIAAHIGYNSMAVFLVIYKTW